MHYPEFFEVLNLHRQLILQSGGTSGLRDEGGLESAIAQPRMTFGGVDLYSTITEKAAALAYSLILNHPFVDGNERVGHAAMETFLADSGHEIPSPVDEQERVILRVAAGEKGRDEFAAWLAAHIVEHKPA